MYEPPVARAVTWRRIMVGYPGRPPVVVEQIIITREEGHGDTQPNGNYRAIGSAAQR